MTGSRKHVLHSIVSPAQELQQPQERVVELVVPLPSLKNWRNFRRPGITMEIMEPEVASKEENSGEC